MSPLFRFVIAGVGALIGLGAGGCKTLDRPSTNCGRAGDCFSNEVCCLGVCAKACNVYDAGGDAGVDGGVDAGADAGADAGSDAGADAGSDAGPDAGPLIDAGPPLTCTTPYRFEKTDASVNATDFALAIDSQRADVTAAWLRAADASAQMAVAAHFDFDLGWGNPVVLSSPNAAASSPTVERDDAGNAIAAWLQTQNGKTSLWAARYSATLFRWSDAGVIYDGDAGSPAFPRLAVEPAGHAVAVWVRWSTVDQAWSASYSATTDRWTSPVKLSVGPEGAVYTPDVAIDSTGTATAAWRFLDGGFAVLSSRWNRFATPWDAGCWALPTEIGARDAGAATVPAGPRVVAEPSGGVTVLWSQIVVPATIEILANSLTPPSSSWAGVERVDVFDGGVPLNAAGARATADDTFAVWPRTDGVRDSVFAAVRRAGVWQAPSRLSNGVDDTAEPRVSANAAGKAVVAWQQLDGGAYSIWVTGGTADGAWKSPTLVATHPDAGLGRPEVVLDSSGYALVIWAGETNGVQTMWSSTCH